MTAAVAIARTRSIRIPSGQTRNRTQKPTRAGPVPKPATSTSAIPKRPEPKRRFGTQTDSLSKVDQIATWIPNAPSDALFKETQASLERSPVEYWNMMMALREKHPEAYLQAAKALGDVIREGGSRDLSYAHRALADMYQMGPHLVPGVIQDVVKISPLAGTKLIAALGGLMLGHLWSSRDLKLAWIASNLTGPGSAFVQAGIATHIAQREGVTNLSIDGALWMVRLEADASAYVEELVASATHNRRAYTKELKRFTKFGMRTNLSTGAWTVFDNLRTIQMPGAQRVKADLLRAMNARYKSLSKRATVARHEAQNEHAQAMAHLLGDPRLIDFLMATRSGRRRLQDMMRTLVRSGDGRAHKTVQRLMRYSGQSAARGKKQGSRAEVEAHARRMNFVVQATTKALKTSAPE